MDRPNDAVWLLDPEGATEEDFERALVHWDELDAASLRALSDHPLQGRRLDALQLAEAWLEDHLEEQAPPAVAACPDADELYDYARGPGSNPLTADRRAQLDRHLIRCRPCEGIARGLQSRPPAPLEDLPPAAALDALDRDLLRRICPPVAAEPLRKRPSILRWAPLAAAASLAAVAVLNRDSADPTRLPQPDVMRGAESWALLSPAGPLLSVPGTAATELLPAGCTPRFELAPFEDATSYTATIFRHGGGALDAGQQVAELSGPDALLGSLALEPGRYTWRARAIVRGLDVDLGARDFEVVENAALLDSLSGKRRAEAVVLLHEAGFAADARRLAEGLPASPERDAFLRRDLSR